MPNSHGTRNSNLDGQLLTPSDIGDVNRSRVIQAFCDYGPLSRADLAKMAGVTRATIGNIVLGLVESGLIEEIEAPERSGRVGKPGRPLWFGPNAGLSGAVSLEADRVQAALINARGDIIDEAVGTFPDDPTEDAVVHVVTTALDAVLPRPAKDILGIGIAVPGVCDTTTGSIVGSGQLPMLRGTKLADTVSNRFDRRVLVDNDSRAQALGEKWFGRGRQVQTFASVQTGHGIGVGLVIGGVVLRGPHGEAGEAGHTQVVQDGALCRCGLHGCWETIATIEWLRDEAARRGIKGANTLDAKVLAARTDDASRDLLRRYAANISIGLANLAHVLRPALFVLHGDAARGGETFRELISEETKERVLPHIRGSIEVVASDLDARAGLLGAAGLVLSETFHLSI
jgi:predicted NBD/HSP70 family sugar kinase